mgnify:CR=1 FL=1
MVERGTAVLMNEAGRRRWIGVRTSGGDGGEGGGWWRRDQLE